MSIAILAWLFNRIGLQNIVEQLAALNAGWYVLAGFVLLLSILARAWRWYVLLTPLGVRVRLWDLFLLYLIGFFWNSFLPSGFGGDVIKAIELRRISRKGAAAVTSVVAERVLGLLATSLIGLLVIALWPRLFPLEAIITVAGMCLVIGAGIWVLRLDVLDWFDRRIPILRPIVTHRRVMALHDAIRTYDRKALALGLLSAVPFTLASILDSYFVGLALHIDLGVEYYALYTPIISLISLLPLSFNGLGVREYTYQVLFGLVGVTPEQSVAMALAFNLLRFGAGLLGGLVSLLGGVKYLLGDQQPQDETVSGQANG